MVEGEEVGALVRESWVIAQGSSRVCRARGRGRLLQVAARLMINEGNEEESDCPEETRSERWGRCGGKGCDKRVEESLVVLVALVTSGGPPRRRCTLGDHPRAKRQWAARRGGSLRGPGLPTTPIHQQFHFISFAPAAVQGCLPAS